MPDSTPGWLMLQKSLNDLYGLYNDKTKYVDFDWKKFLFGDKSQQPQTQTVVNGPENISNETRNTLQSVGVNANIPGATDQVPVNTKDLNTLQSVGVNIPGVTTDMGTPTVETIYKPQQNNGIVIDKSKYSPNNPLLKEIPTGKELIPRTITPRLVNALDQWEIDNKNAQDKAAQQAAEDAYKKDLDFRYKESQIAKMNHDANEPYKTDHVANNGTKEPKDSLLMSYQDIDKMITTKDRQSNVVRDNAGADSLSSQYSLAIRNNISDPNKAQPYIDRYNYINHTGYTIADWQKQSQTQYNPKTNKPVNVANNQNQGKNNNQTQNTSKTTGWFKSHSTAPAGINQKDWESADWLILNSPQASITWVINNSKGKVPPNVYNALLARQRMGKVNNSLVAAK